MVFNRSGGGEYVSIRYAERATTDTAFQTSELLKAGESYYVNKDSLERNRWGDYNGIALDPTDNTTIWIFSEYPVNSTNWGTWIGAISHTSFSPTPPAEAGDTSGGSGHSRNCFIATAAYGSPLHPYVKALREFRDEHLSSNSYGRAFVGFYYKYSPAIAEVIKDSEFLKAVTRVILTPVVMFVVYPYISLVVFIAFLLSSIIAFRMVRRQRIRV